MDSTLVIKAKCGETLRRFNVPINENGLLELDMSGLRAKILGLFNFPHDTDVILTYVDEDGDVVTLVDDNDLVDVMKQSLKFLRIDVQPRNEKLPKSNAKSSSGTSTPRPSPHVPLPLPDFNAAVGDVLKAVPQPLHETLSKLSLDLASKAVCSNSVLAHLIDCVSKMGQSLSAFQQSSNGASSSTHLGIVESAAPAAPNATNHETGQETRAENVTGAAVPQKPVLTPVDLNLDPSCASNPSGYATSDIGKTVSSKDGKGNMKQDAPLPNWSVGFGAPSSTSDSVRLVGSECPFLQIPMESDSSTTPIVFPRISPSRRRVSGRNDAMGGMFHRGVQCDGCGAHPITGPRYKSKVREDYDLCSICFTVMGNEADFIKIDRPVYHRHPWQFKGPQDHKLWSPPPAHVLKHFGMKPARGKLDSRFIVDVNVLDGTMMAPSTPFTKIWRLRNSGTVAWPQGARLVWMGGDRFSHSDFAELDISDNGLPVEGEIDVAVDFTSPKLSGRYISYWKMATPSGIKFGQRVWVLINVVAPAEASVSDGSRGLNLNIPPDWRCPVVLDVNVQPVVDSGISEPNSTATSAVVPPRPMVDVDHMEKEQACNFPTNDSLLVGDGVSTPGSSRTSRSPLYPIIELSGAGPSEAVPVPNVPTSPEEADAEDVVEKSLLKELEVMGFRQVDLNKEILRLNEYDLEQSVDDLCGVSEWDPILEELKEMGFEDETKNRKLLRKNNGSIKGVVMDLLTGEKA